MKPNIRKHKDIMEQEHIIELMANAMRNIHLGYVADCGRMSANMEMVWYKYVQFAIRSTYGEKARKVR